MEVVLQNLKLQNLIQNFESINNKLFTVNNNNIIIIDSEDGFYNIRFNEKENMDFNDANYIQMYSILESLIKKNLVETFVFKTQTGQMIEKVHKLTYLSFNLKNLIAKHEFKIKLK